MFNIKWHNSNLLYCFQIKIDDLKNYKFLEKFKLTKKRFSKIRFVYLYKKNQFYAFLELKTDNLIVFLKNYYNLSKKRLNKTILIY